MYYFIMTVLCRRVDAGQSLTTLYYYGHGRDKKKSISLPGTFWKLAMPTPLNNY